MRFIPADMNHQKARESRRKKGCRSRLISAAQHTRCSERWLDIEILCIDHKNPPLSFWREEFRNVSGT